jgi:hypothetical protein
MRMSMGMKVGVVAIVGLLAAGTAWAEYGDASIVLWEWNH